jgi:hypothetical protein
VQIVPLTQPDATEIAQGQRKINADLVKFMRNDPSVREVHFLPKDVEQVISAHVKELSDAKNRADLAQQEQRDREYRAVVQANAERNRREQKQMKATFIAQPKNHTASCISGNQLIRPGSTLDTGKYNCSGLPAWEWVTIQRLQDVGYEVAQSDQQPVNLVDQ